MADKTYLTGAGYTEKGYGGDAAVRSYTPSDEDFQVQQHVVGHETSEETSLHRGLKARHISKLPIALSTARGRTPTVVAVCP